MNSWDLFVLRHRDPVNHVIHFISFLLFCFSPLFAWIFWNPWILIGFFISGIVGAIGHYVTGDGGGVSVREATSTPGVPFYVAIMFYKLFRGTYKNDLAIADQKFAKYKASLSR